jgi:glutamyl-tRNA reductase
VRLALIHQAPGPASAPSDAVRWRTCLREIAFLGDASAPAPDAPVTFDADAYALLLEIVCGLRSPLIGETEVQAQFKTFLASLDRARHGNIFSLGQRVLSDAKAIRQRHLQGFGTHSYGHLVRARIAPDQHLVVIGTGALAQEILAALDDRPSADQWGRKPEHADEVGDRVRYRLFVDAPRQPVGTMPATIVIAAPAGQADLEAVSRTYARIDRVIDLRAVDQRTSITFGAALVTLDDLFDEARAAGAAPARSVDAAHRDIEALARAFGQREELHPFGWDDVCA